MKGFRAIFIKEFLHIRKERSTIGFTLIVPAVMLTIFGYAIDVSIENIPTVVFNLDGHDESRRLVEAVENTNTFSVIRHAGDIREFRQALVSGRARTGILIPAGYSEKILRREQAQVQVLIDGSDSQVATTALNTVNLLAINLSLGHARAMREQIGAGQASPPGGLTDLPLDVRPRLLYNPDLDSSYFFVPGLIGIILQLVLVILTSLSIVRERELGTLEQIFVTPVSRSGFMLGKLLPYTILAFGTLLIVLFMMTTLFGVRINGSLLLLFMLAAVFILTALGLGLLVSTVARAQVQAIQFTFMIMMPSVLLSGFIFPRSEMPFIIYLISCVLPVTYFIEILRGIVLRGADLYLLLPHIFGLLICLVVVLGLSLTLFKKQID